MSEHSMREKVNTNLKRFKLDPVSVENEFACPGTPDVNCTLGWIELKELPEWPKLSDTVVAIDHYTPQQRVWLYKRWRADKRAWMLLKVGRREWLLFDGNVASAEVGRCDRDRLYQISRAHWQSGMGWESLVECLRNPI